MSLRVYRKGKKTNKVIKLALKKPVTFSQKVRRVVNRKKETKYHTNLGAVQTFGNIDPVTNRAYLNDISDVAQTAGASTDTTRIGDQIELTGIKIKYLLSQNVSAAINDTVNRVIIFQWKGDVALTTAEIGRILQNGPSAAGTADLNSLSHYNHDYRHMYTILYDKSFAMSDQGANPKTLFSDVKNIRIKKATKMINYVAGSATAGDHHIYLLVIGLAPELTSTITFDARIFFKDS